MIAATVIPSRWYRDAAGQYRERPITFATVAAILGDRESRKVGHNNVLHRVHFGPHRGAIALRYHDTDVITWHADGSRTIVPWDSVTTRKRFSDWLTGASIGTESGFQYLAIRGGRTYGLGDCDPVRIGPRGGVRTGRWSGAITADAHAARVREHKREMAREARARRKLRDAEARAAALAAGARTVFGYAFAGDVARREAVAAAYLHAVRVERYRAERATGRRAVPAWRDAAVRGAWNLTAYDRAREHAADAAAAAVAAMGRPIAEARRRQAVQARDVIRGAVTVFGYPFAAIATGRRNHLWLARHGIAVDADGYAWLYKNVNVRETLTADGSDPMVLMSAHRGHGGPTVWEIGRPTVCPDWDPSPRCGGGLHASPTAEMAESYVRTTDPRERLMVRVRVADMVIITDDKCKVPRVDDVAQRPTTMEV